MIESENADKAVEYLLEKVEVKKTKIPEVIAKLEKENRELKSKLASTDSDEGKLRQKIEKRIKELGFFRMGVHYHESGKCDRYKCELYKKEYFDAVIKPVLLSELKSLLESETTPKKDVKTLPTQSYVNLLLEAGAQLRSLGRVRWLEVETKQPMKGPSPITGFYLPANLQMGDTDK